MYDRLYLLEITHPELENKLLRIEGDSSKLSLNIDFNSTLMMSGGCLGGNVSVYGLRTDIVEKLSVLARDRFVNGRTSNEYMLRLSIGCRELGANPNDNPKYVCILDGFVVECLPSALPERALRFNVSAGNVYSRLLTLAKNEKEKKELAKTYISLREYAASCANEIMENDNTVNIRLDDEWKADLKILNTNHPTNADDFVKNFLNPYGIPYEDQLISRNEEEKSGKTESQSHSRRITVGIDSTKWVDIQGEAPVKVSEATGMIGLPMSADHGASVAVQMKVPIALGRVIDLESKIAPTFNHKDYVVRQVNYSGSFYGDNWQQTLQLYRGH